MLIVLVAANTNSLLVSRFETTEKWEPMKIELILATSENGLHPNMLQYIICSNYIIQYTVYSIRVPIPIPIHIHVHIHIYIYIYTYT